MVMPEPDDMQQQIPAGEEILSAPPDLPETTRKAAGRGSSALPDFASLDTERAVIAALMTDPTCFSVVGSILGGLSSPGAVSGKKRSGDPNEIRREMFHGMASTIFYDP